MQNCTIKKALTWASEPSFLPAMQPLPLEVLNVAGLPPALLPGVQSHLPQPALPLPPELLVEVPGDLQLFLWLRIHVLPTQL